MSSLQATHPTDGGRVGRPSKGDRAGLMVRVHHPLRELFAREAADRGVSQSDLMAEILALRYPNQHLCGEEGGMMRQSA